jgi:putative ABC transport system ATP-binding protein
MGKTKEIISLEDVAKIYQMGDEEIEALGGVDLGISEGDFVAIMGPSGSGKSTGMNMIGSLDVPTFGTVYLDEQDISHLSESELAQIRGKKVGFIFQQFNLIPNLTAKGNIMLPMTFQGMSQEDKDDKAEELLALVDLEDRMNHYPNQLSGGQQQRVAIARALANDPEVILADEPTGNLDTKTGEKVMDFLTKLNKDGKTIIMVTHDPELAKNHARTIFSIRDGKVVNVMKKVHGKWKDSKKKGSGKK